MLMSSRMTALTGYGIHSHARFCCLCALISAVDVYIFSHLVQTIQIHNKCLRVCNSILVMQPGKFPCLSVIQVDSLQDAGACIAWASDGSY